MRSPGEAAAACPDLSATGASQGRQWLRFAHLPALQPHKGPALCPCRLRARRVSDVYPGPAADEPFCASLRLQSKRDPCKPYAPELRRQLRVSALPCCCASWGAWPGPVWGVPMLKWSSSPPSWAQMLCSCLQGDAYRACNVLNVEQTKAPLQKS